ASIPQKITMLSHFNSKATEGKAAEFITKYTEKHGADTLNQFGASAYDCVYAIYNAMKAAIDAGENITPDISASDLCEILKKQFNGGFTYSGNTGDNIKWQSNGYVDKSAIAFVIKEHN
ncbi:MAG: amino acid ABC transporter substrate-binding protein, partial [Clostridia bacterium]|nr:amino acid ABC transporter substrate-binding protein [Clostridia bacterium]